MKLSTYLTFNGNCEQAMNFYKDVLNADICMMSRFTDMPGDVCEVPEEMKDLIMHCTLEFDGNTLMASDTIQPEQLRQGSNYTLSINSGNEEEAYTVFSGLAKKGKIVMPFEEAFWGGKFGMLIDRFGIQWMVTSNHKPG